jgi:hypothetical protein
MIVVMTVGGLSLNCGRSKQCTDTITGAVVVCFDDSDGSCGTALTTSPSERS